MGTAGGADDNADDATVSFPLFPRLPACYDWAMSTSSGGQRWHEHLLTLAVPLLPALLACFHILNGDIGFHVATGRAIDLLGSVPTTNVLSFAQPDQPWVLHQWIPAWLFHRLEAGLGTGALVWFKCGVIYLTFLALWRAMREEGTHPGPPLLLFAIASGVAALRFYVRPFIFSMLGLALFLWLAAAWLRSRRPSRLYAMVPVAALFAAFHAGVVYLLLAMGALVAAEVTGAVLARIGRGRPAPPWPLHALAAFSLALLGAALSVWLESPHGVEALLLPFRYSTDAYFHEHLVEFRPLAFDLPRFPCAWTLRALTAAGALWRGVAAWRSRDSQVRTEALFELLLAGGFAYLALKHQRIVFAFALASAFVLARQARALLSPLLSARLAWLLALVALLVGGAATARQFSAARFGPGVDDRFYPRGIFAFLDDHGLGRNTYVSDAWGGHWLWHYYPTRRVFYDNRLEAYTFDFYLHDYQAIRYGEEGWQEKLDRYAIETLVLKYSTPGERRFQEGRPNIRDLAFAAPEWRLVYWDDLGEVFVRAEGPGCPDGPAFRNFNPDTLLPAAGAPTRAVWRELELAWRQMPSARACYALARALRDEGLREEAAGLLKEGLARYPDHPLLLSLAASL